MSKDSRLNNNSLSGPIPMSLTNITALQVLWVPLYLKICYSFLYFLYAILIFFSSIYLSNVGICLIIIYREWFPIMAPSHYSLLSGFLLNFWLLSHWFWFVNFFINGIPFSVLQTTWIYVDLSLGTLVQALLHFLLLPLLSLHLQFLPQVIFLLLQLLLINRGDLQSLHFQFFVMDVACSCWPYFTHSPV